MRTLYGSSNVDIDTSIVLGWIRRNPAKHEDALTLAGQDRSVLWKAAQIEQWFTLHTADYTARKPFEVELQVDRVDFIVIVRKLEEELDPDRQSLA